mgnify:CR=1 FL=1
METTVSLDNVLDFINLMSLSHQHKRWLDGVAEHIRRVGVKHCCISKITIAELLYDTAWGGHKENRKEVRCNSETVRCHSNILFFVTLCRDEGFSAV